MEQYICKTCNKLYKNKKNNSKTDRNMNISKNKCLKINCQQKRIKSLKKENLEEINILDNQIYSLNSNESQSYTTFDLNDIYKHSLNDETSNFKLNKKGVIKE
jgi:hypothetical protein